MVIVSCAGGGQLTGTKQTVAGSEITDGWRN